MDRKQLIWPNEWPLLPNSARPFVWQCCANDVKWVSHNKCFFFQAQSCLAGQPLLPQLLMCVATDGSRRVERFRIVDSKFVGVGYINQFGNIKGQTADTVMVEVGLIRVEKPEYELLVKEGHQLARGRRPSPILRIRDFVSTDADDAVLTHWLESPQDVDSPLRLRIDQILPHDTTKTQFLFRINKGIKDISDNDAINQYVPPAERPVPFSRMIYVGDGETDIPCMKLVKEQGGYSIAVYNPRKFSKKKISEKLKRENRVNFCIPADYSVGSKMESMMELIIDKMACECKMQSEEKRVHRREQQIIPEDLESEVSAMEDD